MPSNCGRARCNSRRRDTASLPAKSFHGSEARTAVKIPTYNKSMPSLPLSISAAELRLAVRLLRRQPVVTVTTVLALAVGIGMATTGFTLLDSVLFSRLPYPNGDRFVVVEVYTEPGAERGSLDA